MKANHLGYQRGSSLVEVLVSIALLAISGLAIAQGTIRSFAYLNQNYRTSLASQAALDYMELLSQRDPSTLGPLESEHLTPFTHSGVGFFRTTSIQVNSDGSRRIVITITSPVGLLGKTTLTTTIPLRGNV